MMNNVIYEYKNKQKIKTEQKRIENKQERHCGYTGQHTQHEKTLKMKKKLQEFMYDLIDVNTM